MKPSRTAPRAVLKQSKPRQAPPKKVPPPNPKMRKNLSNIQEEEELESPNKPTETIIEYNKVAALFYYVKLMGKVFAAWKANNSTKCNEACFTFAESNEASLADKNRNPELNSLQSSLKEVNLMLGMLKMKSVYEKICLKNKQGFIGRLRILGVKGRYEGKIKDSELVENHENTSKDIPNTKLFKAIVEPFTKRLKILLQRKLEEHFKEFIVTVQNVAVDKRIKAHAATFIGSL